MEKLIFRKKGTAIICLILGVFAVLFYPNNAPVSSREVAQLIEFEKKGQDMPADSPFLDETPRIDEEAASDEKKEDPGEQNYEILLSSNGHCRTLPQNLWVMLLGIYIFLLLFNLSFELEKRKKLRWFWEALYTMLALLAWYNFDQCRGNSWFAQSVIFNGIIIYSFYLYFWSNKIKKSGPKPKLENEMQEKLDLR
jgi:hypothetical protein